MIYTYEEQLMIFKKDKKYRKIVKAANKNEIIELKEKDLKILVSNFNSLDVDLETIKFVPASGAASRMFKHLFQYIKNEELTPDVKSFYDNIEMFAFYDKLYNYVNNQNVDFDDLKIKYDKFILECLLEDDHLAYGNLPKALIEFHKYDNSLSTPIDEHIFEDEKFMLDNDGEIHFTISKNHEDLFLGYVNNLKTDIKISYSFQKDITN